MPAISTENYVDTLASCSLVRRAVGDLTIRRDAIIENSGRPDPVKLDAEEIAVERLPNHTLVLRSQPLLRNRQLSDIAWQLFGSRFPAGDGFRRSAISSATIDVLCDMSAPPAPPMIAYQERVGVCRDFADLAVASAAA